MKKKYKATGVLAASVMGAVATAVWPVPGLAGHIIHNGFLAATIGGMADWFAVTAIFRKPLGISYKTEILIKNRQRIMEALVEFAGQDLLSTENVMKFVGKQNVAEFLARYIEYQGKDNLANLTADVASALFRQIDVPTVAGKIAPAIREMMEEKLISPFGDEIINRLTTREQSELIIHTLLTIGPEILQDEQLKEILKDNIGEVIKAYEGDGGGRAFVMGLLGLDAEKLTGVLLEKADEWIDATLNDSQRLDQLTGNFYERLQALAQGQDLRNNLQATISNMCRRETIEAMLGDYIGKAIISQRLIHLVDRTASEALQRFVENDEWQARVDGAIKAWMAQELENNHSVITALIEERLNGLSDEELVEFTEEKVADDLQMIRINGSVVGALAGMALSVVVYLAGQVISP